MQRSLFSPAPFLLFTWSVLLLLVACTAPSTEVSPSVTRTIALTLTQTPTVSPTLVPSATGTPTTRPTRRPTSTIAPTRTPVYSPPTWTPIPPKPTIAIGPITWLVNRAVVEFSAKNLNYHPWLDGNTLVFKENDQLLSVDVLQNKLSESTLQPTPTVFPYAELSLSPYGKYSVTCANESLSLSEVNGNRLISSVQDLVYCGNIRWKFDGTALTFVSYVDGQVYVWLTDGTVPRPVATAMKDSPANWSPDGTKILVIRGNPDELGLATFDIAFPDGFPPLQTATEISAGANWYPWYPHWFTDEIVVNVVAGASYAIETYYDSIDGSEILSDAWFRFSALSGETHQQKSVISSDEHWIVMDVRDYMDENPNRNYILFDMVFRESFELSDNPETNLIFLDWSADSTIFYLITRPVTETVQSASSLPYGLLALDPTTRQFTPIIPSAMYATLNSQQTHVFTLLPENDHLTAALHTLSGDLLATFQPVTDDIPYFTPGEGLPIPAAWSNDGTRIVFADVWGDLWLADTSGVLTQLADNLGFNPAYPRQPEFSWSPDDSHLLITLHDRAWVVTLP